MAASARMRAFSCEVHQISPSGSGGSPSSGDWFVVPGSGTAGLTALRGEGGFRANLGEGAQVHLDYWFE